MLLTRVGPAVDRRILETAREITRQALPIKCVEAVFLATYLTQVTLPRAGTLILTLTLTLTLTYLTQGLRELERVPVSFKSQVVGNTYTHITLAVVVVVSTIPNTEPMAYRSTATPTSTSSLRSSTTPSGARWG